jgi:PAS domain S-box-containing protein
VLAALGESSIAFDDGLLRTLIDELSALVSFWDLDLKCLYANKAHSRWFNIEHSQILGLAMQEIVAPDLYADCEPMARAALRGERQDFAQLMRRPNGDVLHLMVTFLPMIVDGVTTGLVSHIMDVSQVKLAQGALRDEIGRHTDTIEALAAAADKIARDEAAFRRTLRLNGQIPVIATADFRVRLISDHWIVDWEALTGRSVSADLDVNIADLIYVEDHERARKEARHIVGSPAMTDGRYRIIGKDSVPRWMRFRVAPDHDENGQLRQWLGTIEDIDDLVRAEERAQEIDAAYRQTIDLHGQIPWTAPADGSVFMISEAWRDRWFALTGRSTDVRLDSYTGDLMHPDDLVGTLRETAERIAAGLPIDQRYRLRAPDGTYRWFRSRAVPRCNEQGTIIAWYGTLEDIHDQVMSEQRVHRLELELAHFARVAAMNSLASTLAHELSQPLAAVANYVSGAQQLIRSGDMSKLQRVSDALISAAAATQRSSEIVHGMRSMVAKGSGNRQPENVARLIERSSLLAMADAKAKDIDYRVEIDPDVDTAWVDRIQLEQVFINLLRNAVEAVANTPVREITLKARLEGPEVYISVSDSGPGVAPEIIENLFGAFNSTKVDGLGVGLSICRTIVEANGGQILYERNPANGACFTVCVPTKG